MEKINTNSKKSTLFPVFSVEVSNDGWNFSKLRTVTDFFQLKLNLPRSFYKSLNKFIKSWRGITKEMGFNKYKIRVLLQETDFLITDINFIESLPNYFPPGDNGWEEKKKFDLLTKMEKEYLCFLYRKYKIDSFLIIFKVTVNTYKTHCKSLYKKMNFRNRNDLILWSEKYLNDFLPKDFSH